MPNSEFKKKVIYFVIFTAVVTLIQVMLPSFEESARSMLFSRFGIIANGDWVIRMADGSIPDKMLATTIGLASNVLQILRILMWMALVIATVRFILFLYSRTIYRSTTQGEASSLIKTVLSVVIYIVAFFIIFQNHYPDVQLAPLFTGSTIIGIVVGLALQDTLGNLFAGLALQADQPFQVGDVVIISGRGEGVVENVSWRGVSIRTFRNTLLVISNSVLGKETIEVAPKNNLNARNVFFNTLYSNSPAATIPAVREAVRQVDNVSKKMRPVVRVRNLGDNGIDWEVKYWLEDYAKQHDSDAMIRQRIWYVFQREGIDFAYPTRTVHVEPRPEESTQLDIMNSITERLNRVSIFSPLCDDEINRLANASSSRIYAPDEAIVRLGQEGSSMFVIIRGSVKVQVPDNNVTKTVNTLRENDFFGEMCLLTGEPRSANVIAVEETEVLRIDKNGLKPIFEENPSLVESISELIEERRVVLKSQDDKETENKNTPQKGAIRSIRKFFGLK